MEDFAMWEYDDEVDMFWNQSSSSNSITTTTNGTQETQIHYRKDIVQYVKNITWSSHVLDDKYPPFS